MKKKDIVSQLQNNPFSSFQGSGIIMSEIIEEEVNFQPEDFRPPELQTLAFPTTDHNIFLGEEGKKDENILGESDGKVDVEMDEEEFAEMELRKFEKIRWQIPSHKDEKGKETRSTRFDFDGNIISEEDEKSKPFPNEYYHHGKEPDRPGYSLEEILMLIRSENMGQKLLFLEVFSKVLKVQQKKNFKFYDVHIIPLFDKLKLFDLLQVIGKRNKKNRRVFPILSDIYHTLFQADQFIHISRLQLKFTETRSVPYISPLPHDPTLQRSIKEILPSILDRDDEDSSSSSTLFSSLHSFIKPEQFEKLFERNPDECIKTLYFHFTQNNGHSTLPLQFHKKICQHLLEVIHVKKEKVSSVFFHGLVQFYTTTTTNEEKEKEGKQPSSFLSTSHRGLLKFSVLKVHEYIEMFPSSLPFLNFYLPGRNHVIFDILSKFTETHVDDEEFEGSYLGTIIRLLFPIITTEEYLKDRNRKDHPVKKILGILRKKVIQVFHDNHNTKSLENEKDLLSSWKEFLRRKFGNVDWWKYNSNKGSPNMILSLENEELGINRIEKFYSDLFLVLQILKFSWEVALYDSQGCPSLPHEEMIWEACISLFLSGDLGRSALVSEVYVNRYRKFAVLPVTDFLRFLVKACHIYLKKRKSRRQPRDTFIPAWDEKIMKNLEFYLLYLSTQPRTEKIKLSSGYNNFQRLIINNKTSSILFDENEGEDDDDDSDDNSDLMNICFFDCVENVDVRKRLKEVILSRNFGLLQGDWFLFVIEEYYRNPNDQGGVSRIWSPSLIHPTLVCLNELENYCFDKYYNSYVDVAIPFHVRFMNLLKLLLQRNEMRVYESPSIREEMFKYLDHYFHNYFSHRVTIFDHATATATATKTTKKEENTTKLRNEDEESMFLEFVDMMLLEYKSVSFRDGLFTTFLLVLLGNQWSIRTRTKILNDMKRCLFIYFQNIEEKYQNLFFAKNCGYNVSRRKEEKDEEKEHFELAKVIVEDYFDSEEACEECKIDNPFMYKVLMDMLKDFLGCENNNYRFFILKKLNPLLRIELKDILQK